MNASDVQWLPTCHSSWNPLFPFFAQGARCGHIEGANRAGLFTNGEEYQASDEATEAQAFTGDAAGEAWARGYRYGYRQRAMGEALDSEIENAPLPGSNP